MTEAKAGQLPEVCVQSFKLHWPPPGKKNSPVLGSLSVSPAHTSSSSVPVVSASILHIAHLLAIAGLTLDLGDCDSVAGL